jgi:hypothetical protein
MPRDELEGMIAAQLLAAHNAAMECYRRAMLGDQTFEGRRENLSQANKLSRTHSVLIANQTFQTLWIKHSDDETRDQQLSATVQGLVGIVSSRRSRWNTSTSIPAVRPSWGWSRVQHWTIHRNQRDNPMRSKLPMAPQPAMWGPNSEPEVVPSASDAEWPMPNARRNVTGSTKGK